MLDGSVRTVSGRIKQLISVFRLTVSMETLRISPRIGLEPIGTESSAEISDMAFPLLRDVYSNTPADVVEEFLRIYLTPEAIADQIRAGAVYAFIICDGERAGFMAYEVDCEGMHLSKLYLLPEFRGNGIGSAVIGYVEDRAREDGLDSVHLEVNEISPRTIAFYERLGYRASGRMAQMRIVMRKDL